MAQENSGLLIAALVAIVAVVGLVILFSGAQSAAVYKNPFVGQTGLCACPDGYQAQFTGRSGSLATCTCHKPPQSAPLY